MGEIDIKYGLYISLYVSFIDIDFISYENEEEIIMYVKCKYSTNHGHSREKVYHSHKYILISCIIECSVLKYRIE